jgi:hypothetical protein
MFWRQFRRFWTSVILFHGRFSFLHLECASIGSLPHPAGGRPSHSISGAASAKETFWVGVNGYWTARVEFIDHTFTDDVFFKNAWKKDVSPGCMNAR